jgi:hypothetical protein
MNVNCEIRGLYSGTAEDSSVLERETFSTDKYLPTYFFHL